MDRDNFEFCYFGFSDACFSRIVWGYVEKPEFMLCSFCSSAI